MNAQDIKLASRGAQGIYTSKSRSTHALKNTYQIMKNGRRSGGVKMSDKNLPERPYERIAMQGGEMPDGLDYPDQILFLSLRLLYNSYNQNIIDRNTAKREKAELLRTYSAHKIVEAMGREWIAIIKKSEQARANYRKEKTIENADKMLLAVEGQKYVP